MSGSTNNTRRIGGIASFYVDGTPYDLAEGLEYCPASVKRETKVGQGGIPGYIEMPVPGWISAKLFDNGALTVADFNSMTFNTVQAVLANGKTVIATNAWCTAELTVGTGDSPAFDVKFESDDVTEING